MPSVLLLSRGHLVALPVPPTSRQVPHPFQQCAAARIRDACHKTLRGCLGSELSRVARPRNLWDDRDCEFGTKAPSLKNRHLLPS